MKNRGETPGVNAGSMADIAFLLLIFFLVTTSIETDVGFNRMLSPIDISPPLPYNDKNILLVQVNHNNEILVDNELVDITDLRRIAVAFIDNGGATLDSEHYCDYCQGERSVFSSENPNKAVISLSSERDTGYATFIAIQNELVGAYNQLRNREALKLYGVKYTDMESEYLNVTSKGRKAKLKEKIETIKRRYPQKLSEAEIK
ncbi:ExbD/TolR family protein [Maribacter algicola]|uniref:ExbD/TolR family protein n=1 Tax=Meishania litoralis TaxID=3434685 RepID=A0ACC7LHH3_9FLAO